MRVIIEVDNDQELEEVLDRIGDLPIEIKKRYVERQERLRALFSRLNGQLPADYRFDRSEAYDE